MLTNLSNHKFSPPMQIITTMAKPKLISGQIFKPFCCAVFWGGCLLGLVWVFCGGWFVIFLLLYLKWVAPEAVQSRVPPSLLQVLCSQISDAITPLWPLEMRGVGQKNLSEKQLRSGWYLQANSNLPNLWLGGNFTHSFPGSKGLCTMFYATAAESLLHSVNCPI